MMGHIALLVELFLLGQLFAEISYILQAWTTNRCSIVSPLEIFIALRLLSYVIGDVVLFRR